VKKLDDLTVEFSFPLPFPLFELRLAAEHGSLPLKPKHYMKDFHPNYNDAAALDKAAKDAGYDNWWQLFPAMDHEGSNWSNADRPTQNPWYLATPLGADPQVVFKRHPYFWKVDTEGNQLPYLDEVFFNLHAEVQSMVMDVVAGEIDFQHRHIDNAEYFPLFSEHAEEQGYEFFWNTPDKMCTAAVKPNLTHSDPVMREILQNKDFRIALSHAIDRPAICETVWRGLTEPRGIAPWPESGFGHTQLETQYLEYDPEKADAMLDDIFPDNDGDGFRLGPDGKRIFFSVEIIANHVEIIDMMEMVKQYWADVGIDIALKPEDRSLWTERRNAGEYDTEATKWVESGLFPLLGHHMWVPYSVASAGREWAYWYITKGESGEEPPEAIKRQLELRDQLYQEPDPDKVRELFMEILDIAADNFHNIPITSKPLHFGVKKIAFHNIPLESFAATPYPDPAPTNPCQYFWKE
jgi:peptide/nickel transport system substrate-binding protein